MTTLITPDALAEWLASDEPPLVFDVQFRLSAPGHQANPTGAELYAGAHLPGANFLDVDTDLAGPPGPHGRHPMPDLDHLQHRLRAAGLDDGRPVVVYDEGNGLGAARAWWLLSYCGLADVRVLDGGLSVWRTAGHAVTDHLPEVAESGDATLRPGALPLLDADGAAALAQRGLLLDARTPERFAGLSEPIDAVAGHIPGAHNAPMGDYVQPDGRLADRETLHGYFAAKGAFTHPEVGAYCGSGITAAHLALALRQIGIIAPVYVGSWSEWIADPARPIATGAAVTDQ